MELDEALASELKAIIAGARAHLEREADLAAPGLPLHAAAEALAQRAAEVAPARASAPREPSERTQADPRLVTSVERKAPRADAEPAPAQATTATPAAVGDKLRVLEQLARDASTCTACVLHERRKQAVFARGNPDAELVFVGEGPGAEEDRLGLPFVGPAGQLLDRMIVAMGYARDDVYVCNVVKCRPPENRTPRPEEAIACSRFLVPQLEQIAPKMIIALGRCAAENLGVAKPEGRWRGLWGSYRGIPVMPTYHPAYLLRSPEQKRIVWDDLKLAMQRLGKPVPDRKT